MSIWPAAEFRGWRTPCIGIEGHVGPPEMKEKVFCVHLHLVYLVLSLCLVL